jgi:hypothetical protein
MTPDAEPPVAARLYINKSESRCGACNRGADPYEESHLTLTGWAAVNDTIAPADSLDRLDRAIDRAATNGKVDAKIMHDFIADLRAEDDMRAALRAGGSASPDADPWPTLDDLRRMTAAEVNAFFAAQGVSWRVRDDYQPPRATPADSLDALRVALSWALDIIVLYDKRMATLGEPRPPLWERGMAKARAALGGSDDA